MRDRKIKEYLTITETGIEAFNKTVNEYLAKGWEPIGGASLQVITIHKNNGVYFQYEYTQTIVLYDNIVLLN
jgi:hypothetical protein